MCSLLALFSMYMYMYTHNHVATELLMHQWMIYTALTMIDRGWRDFLKPMGPQEVEKECLPLNLSFVTMSACVSSSLVAEVDFKSFVSPRSEVSA